MCKRAFDAKDAGRTLQHHHHAKFLSSILLIFEVPNKQHCKLNKILRIFDSNIICEVLLFLSITQVFVAFHYYFTYKGSFLFWYYFSQLMFSCRINGGRSLSPSVARAHIPASEWSKCTMLRCQRYWSNAGNFANSFPVVISIITLSIHIDHW